MNSPDLFENSGQDTSSVKTSLVSFQAMADGILPASLESWASAGRVTSRGELWTLNISEWPKDGAVCSLSQILEANVPAKYYLSPKACAGILRRAAKRGKELPEHLRLALTAVATGGGFRTEPGAHLVAETCGTLSPGAHPGGLSGQDAYNGQLIAHTLRGEGFDASEDGTGRDTPLVFDERVITSPGNRSEVEPDKPCPTLNGGASMTVAFQTRGSNIALGQDIIGTIGQNCDRASGGAPCVAFSCKDSGNDAGDLSPTLRSMNFAESHMNGGGQVAVAFQESQSGCREYEDAGTLRANGPGHDPVGTRIRHGSAVRRLTPKECERLQGFPDSHTEGFSDSTRYRMLGNAVAVPCAVWIFKSLLK